MNILFPLAALDVTLSIVAVALYGGDKAAAKRHGWRVPERTLHLVALLGGWPGALIAQRLFRHKTSKRSFQRAFRGTIALNVVLTFAWVSLVKLLVASG